jgi:Ca-activated chloride channel family protein
MAPYPYQGFGGTRYVHVPVEIDENTLIQIAETADGQYYRATSNSKLKEVYAEIDQLERTKLNVKDFSRKTEEYMPFAIWAMVCLIIEVLLRLTILRRIP